MNTVLQGALLKCFHLCSCETGYEISYARERGEHACSLPSRVCCSFRLIFSIRLLCSLQLDFSHRQKHFPPPCTANISDLNGRTFSPCSSSIFYLSYSHWLQGDAQRWRLTVIFCYLLSDAQNAVPVKCQTISVRLSRTTQTPQERGERKGMRVSVR